MSTERFSGAEWFKHKKSITVVGCGSIGHTLAINLLMHGHEVTVYDEDHVGEENVFVQGFTQDQVGMKKVDALADNYTNMLIDPFGENSKLFAIPEHWDNTKHLDSIVIMAVDNINVRKEIFEYMKEKYEVFTCIDARVAAESFQVYHVVRDLEHGIDNTSEYATTFFDPATLPPVNCTYKMTRHFAQICQGYIVTILNHYIINCDNNHAIYGYVFLRSINANEL